MCEGIETTLTLTSFSFVFGYSRTLIISDMTYQMISLSLSFCFILPVRGLDWCLSDGDCSVRGYINTDSEPSTQALQTIKLTRRTMTMQDISGNLSMQFPQLVIHVRISNSYQDAFVRQRFLRTYCAGSNPICCGDLHTAGYCCRPARRTASKCFLSITVRKARLSFHVTLLIVL